MLIRTNILNPNIQQIEQNPPSHSLITPVKKKAILVIAATLTFILLIGVYLFLSFRNFENRKIPSSWSTYKNTYYGYSFRYSPDVIMEPDIYGREEGEDLGIELHRLDKEKLKTAGLKDQDQYLRANGFHRGILLGSDYDKWNVQIAKPTLSAENEVGCKRDKTNDGLIYYECIKKHQAWTFTIFLTTQFSNNAFLTIRLDQSHDSFSHEDRLTIKRIVNSFSKESQMSMMTYPTKSDAFRWIKTYWCDKKNKLYEEYTNGLKQYSRYSVISVNKVLDTVYLTKPRSYCEIPIDSMPFVPLESCPFPDRSQVFDNHALGESKQYSVCGGSLPLDSYEYSTEGITSLLQKEILKELQPNGMKYTIMSRSGVAIAAPSNWRMQESPIGSCDSDGGCNADFIEFRDPDLQVIVTVTQGPMLRKNTATKEAVHLGKTECGAYAECELIREKDSSSGLYEYNLLLIGQPNFIAVPKRITVKFFGNKNQRSLLAQIDKIVKSQIFLYENEVNN